MVVSNIFPHKMGPLPVLTGVITPRSRFFSHQLHGVSNIFYFHPYLGKISNFD